METSTGTSFIFSTDENLRDEWVRDIRASAANHDTVTVPLSSPAPAIPAVQENVEVDEL